MAPNPIPPNVVPDQNRAPLVQPSRLWERVWFDWFLGIWKAVKVSVVAGPTGSIQYNDNGVQAGDANLTWDKVTRQQLVIGSGSASPIVAKTSTGVIGLNPVSTNDNEILFGQSVNAAGEYIPATVNPGGIFLATGGTEFGVEIEPGQTPGTPNPFNTGLGVQVGAPTAAIPYAVEAYQFGGLGTGAVPGMILFADRNDSGSGAAGMLGGQLKDGRFFVIWMDATGAMRYNVGATLDSIRPTESGSVSDTSGFLFGSGGGSTTNITQLFTRRGEEGRSGIPGLPGAPGATGSTGATGPAGANGVIISRRADDGATKVMAIGSIGSGSGSGITALTGDVTATGPGSVAATIANSAVTLAKIANASASSKLVGSGSSGSGAAYSEITLGSGLAMSGTTLSASGSSGNATSSTAFGSEPGSPASGDLDLYTNALQIGRYSGSAWVPWRSTPLIDPSLTSWSWINQGTATVSTTNGGIYLFDGTQGTDHIAIREFASPGGNFTRTFGFMAYASQQGASDQFGVCFRESSSGKLVTMGMVTSSLFIAKWNSPTSFSANYSATIGAPTGWLGAFQNPQYLVYFRLGDDGSTNRTFSVSLDGVHFLTLLSQTRTDFMTPDQLGFFVNNRSAGASTAGIGMWLLSLV